VFLSICREVEDLRVDAKDHRPYIFSQLSETINSNIFPFSEINFIIYGKV
jgi:hypothetical protein